MPAVSKSQQRLMALALQVKQGDMSKDDFDSKSLYKKVKKLADSMSIEDLEDYAETKHKNLPDKKEEHVLRKYIRTIIKEYYDNPYKVFEKLDSEIDAMLYDKNNIEEYAKNALDIWEKLPVGTLFDEGDQMADELYDILENIRDGYAGQREVKRANQLIKKLGRFYDYE